MAEQCTQCPYYGLDRSLPHYVFPICLLNGREIAFNSDNGWDKMKWCPQEEQNDKRTGEDP